ncbi:MAG: MarR family winged helix-turn-helix transcriptional regulator [Aestuariivirga sp.]|uniref:MarR family winged helix-turn-helix transcriptional regulator n=1 Tax=Aestuariivirga sp. TaxID=2650926 RepID=UPI0038D2041A
MTDNLAFLRNVLHRETDAETSMPSLAEIGLNHFVPYLLNRIAAIWNAELADELRKFDLTTPQMRALAVLGINSGLTINELSTLTVTEQSTMSRSLDTLESRGLVRRKPRASDLRVREVEITAAGRALFDTFWPLMFGRYQQMFRGISEDDFSQLVATLQRILRNIRPAGPGGGDG